MSTPRPPREHVVMELADAGGTADPPFNIRLRSLLKRMLRAYGIRCVRFLPTGTAPPAEESTDGCEGTN